MTADMVSHARENARKANATNVEFRLGEIEHLPAADASIDVILSNCVINLSPDKPAVFREAFRMLRAGGRLAISDVVVTGPIPVELQNQAAALAGCIAGAAPLDDVRALLSSGSWRRRRSRLASQVVTSTPRLAVTLNAARERRARAEASRRACGRPRRGCGSPRRVEFGVRRGGHG
jgi:ubiquinone/menaquinone biosynthesis C-methylase UbiE